MSIIKTNQVILGKYKILEVIGAGGMGIVYKVYDLEKNVHLAMKVLNIDLDSDSVRIFMREANAYKKLSHPNIVPYYGKDEYEDSFIILMGFIDGDSLKNLLIKFKNKPFPLLDSLVIMKSLCAALGYAHFKDVIHCDLKPGNVLIDKVGNIFLTDFGIARHADSDITNIVGAGTPGYMAPEYMIGKIVTAETDIYALGILLYEMLTGQKIFRPIDKNSDQSGISNIEFIRLAHFLKPAPDPRIINSDISEPLANVILKSLSKEPAERYHSTHEFMLAICEASGISYEEIPERINPALLGSIEHKPPTPDSIPDSIPDPIPPKSRGKKFIKYSFIFVPIMLVILFFIFQDSLSPKTEINAITLNTIMPTFDSSTLIKSYPMPTNTLRIPPTSTIIVTKTKTQIPTRIPTLAKPIFTAKENMFCRDGPGTDFPDRITVMDGQSYPILARWENNWLLLSIDTPITRSKCCWVGGNGDLNMSINKILLIDKIPNRMDCIIK